MIYGILFQNSQNDTRISKYHDFDTVNKKRLEDKVHHELTNRDRKWSHVFDLEGMKVIYRQYSGLIICMLVDLEDNTLAHYELIHLVVEILDSYYGDVCELDIVFNFNRVHNILDDIILAGEIVETSKDIIIEKLKASDKLP
ncbi:clathrin coat assembly protein, putative [Theileria equi strain WA]|uniref:AP complex subunit sigma n=1 Tax=Theileria equi strain WA TaxID=1537102 RepID=L0AUK8_THEEQ|nr:clathrin coat assembly protein, putative [Theileria equi strain WA]AFZ79312.1 clathrin coat assembly protein, putative [Theileria equi strain WA]|eukprot:XP_004828978.1 clathrin coat assembly protein, putative [Theileria equi strain WA]